MTAATPSAEFDAYRLMKLGRFAEALPFAERAVSGSLVCRQSHGLLASILIQLGRIADAEAVVSLAASLETGVSDAYDGLAYVSMILGRHERANSLYRRAAELSPDTPRLWYNFACSERSLGRLAEAEAACDRAIAIDPSQYPSYLLRSELRVQVLEDNHVNELESQLKRPGLDERATFFLGFALAKELDDLKRYDEAFKWFSAAARARRSRLQYDVAIDEKKLGRIVEAYPVDASNSGSHLNKTSRYVFIVGLPRSGTTLVERILTGLPGVRSNGETDHFSRSLLAATPAGPGDIFGRAAAADPDTVGAGYMRLADPRTSSDVILEKLPMNYLYIGAIRRALPEAKILLVNRSPLDSCFAMYRTLFGEAYPFSYDLIELARYYASYARLIDHWRKTSGIDLHEITYEDLVENPRKVGTDIARHCGLTWTNEAVDIQKNSSVSLTASASQVRQPIYGTSSGKWRLYRRHLGDMINELRRRGVILPGDA
jgi:tetratricopeptide (TPR) repeat protein